MKDTVERSPCSTLHGDVDIEPEARFRIIESGMSGVLATVKVTWIFHPGAQESTETERPVSGLCVLSKPNPSMHYY